MRKQLFIFFLLVTSQFTFGQDYQYQVEINDQRSGSFEQRTEVNQSIHTFITLDLQLLGLTDTLQFTSSSHFVESDSGFLKSISWTNSFLDTLHYEVRMSNDTIFYFSLSDSSHIHSPYDTTVYGPEKIRKLSMAKLDTLGAELRYRTFSPELNQIVEVKRKLVGYTIEKAQKQGVVEEIIGSKSTFNKFDKDFYLVRAVSPSPFGDIKLTRTNKIRQSQFFESGYSDQRLILSNIRFPDPNQINSIKLKIGDLDSLTTSSFFHFNQEVTMQDSTSVRLVISSENQLLPSLDSMVSSSPEILWPKSKTTVILDSLIQDSFDLNQKIEKLKSYARIQPQPILTY